MYGAGGMYYLYMMRMAPISYSLHGRSLFLLVHEREERCSSYVRTFLLHILETGMDHRSELRVFRPVYKCGFGEEMVDVLTENLGCACDHCVQV